LTADIVTLTDQATGEVVHHASLIGSLKLSPFDKGLQEVRFLVDCGASRTTLSPYHVLALGIDWMRLPKSRYGCTLADGSVIYPKMLANVEIHVSKRDGKSGGELVFQLPYINAMPPPKSRVIEQTSSLLGMDVLCNFVDWRWDFANCLLHLKP
jgi:hypothetical protein